MIASRVRDEVDSSSLGQTRKPGSELGHNNTNLKTVAVLPVSRNVPIEAFARKLQTALEGMGASTSYLNQTIITNHLGRHAFTRMGKLKVRNLLIVCVCLLSYYSISAVRRMAYGPGTKVSFSALRRRFACEQPMDPNLHSPGKTKINFWTNEISHVINRRIVSWSLEWETIQQSENTSDSSCQ